jgi:hypothetical protein
MNAFGGCISLASTIIPNSVITIGPEAFNNCRSLTGFAIPNNVTSIGPYAFQHCLSLTTVTIPNSVTSIGVSAFQGCLSLTTVTIPNGITSLGSTFYQCTNLTSVTVGAGVTNITGQTFGLCSDLKSVYFMGNAPTINVGSELGAPAIAYYLPGTTGWGPMLGFYWPTMLWNPQVQKSDGTFGVGTNGFGFTITGSSNLVLVVEAATNLAFPSWSPLSTNTLDTFVGTNGTAYFSDPQWANYPSRFYRIRSK